MTTRERHAIEDSAGYDAARDFELSLLEAYRVVRERVAAGGPGWTPKCGTSPQAHAGAAHEPL